MSVNTAALLALCGLGAAYIFIKLGRGIGIALLLLIAIPLGVAFLLVHSYQSFSATTLVATVQAVPLVNQPHTMAVSFTSYDENGKPTHAEYELDGDRAELNANIVAFNPLLNIVGVHNGFSLSRLTSQYDDTNTHTIQPIQLHANNPVPALPWIEESQYQNGVILPADNVTYRIYVTLTGDLYATHA